jgi:hypothetical protein
MGVGKFVRPDEILLVGPIILEKLLTKILLYGIIKINGPNQKGESEDDKDRIWAEGGEEAEEAEESRQKGIGDSDRIDELNEFGEKCRQYGVAGAHRKTSDKARVLMGLAYSEFLTGDGN